jgi:hypothetical protein
MNRLIIIIFYRENVMKISKKRFILFLIAAVIITPLLYSYLNYLDIKVSRKYENDFRQELKRVISQETSFEMKEVTNFDWDQMFIFGPYTSRDDMQRVIGQEWTYYSYIGYWLIQKSFLGKYPLDDDSYNSVVFMKGDKIVLDLTFSRSDADFTHIQGPILKDKSQLFIQNNQIKQTDK